MRGAGRRGLVGGGKEEGKDKGGVGVGVERGVVVRRRREGRLGVGVEVEVEGRRRIRSRFWCSGGST